MNISKQIKQAKDEIRVIMMVNLALIAEGMIDQIMSNRKKLTDSRKLDAIKNVTPKGINKYKQELLAGMAVVAKMAIDQVRKEIPGGEKIKFVEDEERLLFGEFEKLPAKIRKRITNANQLLVGTQLKDLEKVLFFQYGSSDQKDITDKQIKKELTDKAENHISGNSIAAGAQINAATIVNESRNAFFFQDDVLEQIEAFQFVNEVPHAPICIDLSRGGGYGVIFAKDDPNHFKYTGPLHYNCDSWIKPIIKLKKNQKIEEFKPQDPKSEKSIQFHEEIINRIKIY